LVLRPLTLSAVSIYSTARRGIANVLRNRFRPPHELAQELLGFPRTRRLMAAGSCRQYREPALVEHLVEQCFEHRYGDPDKMLDYAETAVAVARQLPPGPAAADALCRALLHLSNSHRRRAGFDPSATAMEQAKAAWASSLQKPALRAEMERLEGALLHDIRHLDPATSCFRTAAELYRSLGDSTNCASALISAGMSANQAGNPQQAVVAAYRALAAIDDRADDKLRITAFQSLAWFLCEAGEHEHAHAISRQCNRLLCSSKEPGIAIRVDLLYARIDDGLGHRLAAEQGYERCREWFAAAGMLYEQALTTLHLAVLLAGEGRTSEVCELCGEVSEVFETLGIARESTAASLLREAMELPKVELLKAVVHCLDREVRQPARRGTAG
jgi:tetratricopeptide (TPR) repeat protein